MAGSEAILQEWFIWDVNQIFFKILQILKILEILKILASFSHHHQIMSLAFLIWWLSSGPGIEISDISSWLKIYPHSSSSRVVSRAEKSKSLIRWKRRKCGKRREKAEKADLVMQLAFWQTCQNAIKCHEMTKCLHFGSGSCIRIFF